jgi:hypothetical protein
VRARVARLFRRDAALGQVNQPLKGDVSGGQLHRFISARGILNACRSQRQCAGVVEKYTPRRPPEKGADAPANSARFGEDYSSKLFLTG